MAKHKLKNDLLLRTLRKEEVHRPPVWCMRQAGRILPHYRKLRAQAGSFKNLVTRPDWIAQATIEPVEVLDVDAAIIFSDILVIPESMGLDYEIIEKKGPVFSRTIANKNDVNTLIDDERIVQRLNYVFDSIMLTKEALDNRVPLIGFAGAPWTIFAYMVEGSGSKTFSKAKKMIYEEPELARSLLDKITNTTIHYIKAKIAAGVDVIQLFDSWAGLLNKKVYTSFAWPYTRRILESVKDVPTIFFPKGAWHTFDELGRDANFDCLGLDWNTSPGYARSHFGKDFILQGNLDPCQLYAPISEIKKSTEQMLRHFGKHHIANLGHGVYPDTEVEKIKCFIDIVKNFDYNHLS